MRTKYELNADDIKAAILCWLEAGSPATAPNVVSKYDVYLSVSNLNGGGGDPREPTGPIVSASATLK